jgi:glycosyltransferase involved in cell wall biosynthesis
MKILILANHRLNRSPGQRFRIEQYIDYLKNNGLEVDFSFFIREKDDKYLYKKGNIIKKLFFHYKATSHRRRDIRKIAKYDVVLIYREAYLLGNIKFEKKIRKKVKKIVFDFDDAIWLPNVSDANKNFSWLKDYAKTEKLIALSDLVFAGNTYLQNYASNYSNNVVVVPTTIDTREYIPQVKQNKSDKICIGWSGSITTIQHFNYAVPFLEKLKEKYKDRIEILVIGDSSYQNQELGVESIDWKKNTELEDLSRIDIGIMPLPDDNWSRGKCGLKGLQYMALEIPTIMSQVGVNTEIIRDGENGFLAEAEEEWIDKLSRLIESKELREKLGKAGRKTVVEQYSFDAWKEKYLEYFRALAE